jgi:putative transposase
VFSYNASYTKWIKSSSVNDLKTVSSRLIRKEFGYELARWYRQPVFWSHSYCVISYGGAPLSVLRHTSSNSEC